MQLTETPWEQVKRLRHDRRSPNVRRPVRGTLKHYRGPETNALQSEQESRPLGGVSTTGVVSTVANFDSL